MNIDNQQGNLNLPVRDGLVWDAVRLAADGAPVEQFLEKAMEAKTHIAKRAYNLWREVQILDDMVDYLAPDEPWVKGWSLDLATGESRAASPLSNPNDSKQDGSARARRILEIADGLLADADTVLSKGIATILLEEGYKGRIRDLSVSAGNVLSRSDRWKRFGPGEYGLSQ